jgi:hypothetical protein
MPSARVAVETNQQTAITKQQNTYYVPDEFELWIYDGEGNYRPQVVLVLAEAEKVRKAGKGYREFRRRLGNYANGRKGAMKDQTNLWIGAILADSTSTPERIRELRNECVNVCKFLWELTKPQVCDSVHVHEQAAV